MSTPHRLRRPLFSARARGTGDPDPSARGGGPQRAGALRPLLAASLLAACAAGAAWAAPAGAQDDTPPEQPDGTGVPESPPTAPTPQRRTGSVFRNCGTASSAPPAQADPRGVNPRAPNPLAGLTFFVDPTEPAYRDMERYQASGKSAEAALVARIATRARARWFGKFIRPNLQAKVRNYLECVQVIQPGAVPLMVVLRHQGKACNRRYTGGGPAEDAATRRWYDDFAQAIGSARVVIGYEPDSLGTVRCLARSRRGARLQVLRYGVDVLSRLPNATIYLEGTASDWQSARTTARQLRFIGIHKVRGFMLNVTHYDWTTDNIRYGRNVSRRVGGKPFVVSTSYNGRGPVHYTPRGRGRLVNVFCNPRFRGVGPPPTTNTGVAGVDAFLWLNRPGLSGAGGCNGGPPVAGTWWPERALMFGRYATNWLGPPRGTRFGFPQRISLCALGAPLRNGKYSDVAPERRCRR